MDVTDYERETARMVLAEVASWDPVWPQYDEPEDIERVATLLASRREGWVDVRERLPKDDGAVLVWGANPGEGDLSYWWRLAGYDKDIKDGWFELVSGDFLRVTHWMPLPTPPEVKP